MNRLLYHAILLAERSHLESLSKRFRGKQVRFDREDAVTGLLILTGFALAIWMLSRFLSLQERHRTRAGPLRLFLSLCRAHRLPWSQRWLLWRVSRAQRLRDPARLFLEPERLEAASFGRSLQTRQAQLKEIRDRLFDQLAEGPQDQGFEVPDTPDHQSDAAQGSPVLPGSVVDIAAETSLPKPDFDISNIGSS